MPVSLGIAGFSLSLRERVEQLITAVGGPSRAAEVAGVTRSTVDNWRKEGATLPMQKMLILATEAGVSLDWIATGYQVRPDIAQLRSFPVRGAQPGGAAPSAEFAEDEAAPYAAESGSDIDRAVAAFIGGRIADVWRLRTAALDLAGVLPGDIAVVAGNLSPRVGDVVVVQTEGLDQHDVRTLWRIYQPPVLLARSTDRTIEAATPLDRAIVMGVVVALFRGRDS